VGKIISMFKFTLLLCLGLLPLSAHALRQVEVIFYSERCQITFDPEMVPRNKITINSNGITKFYSFLEKSQYSIILSDLQKQKNALLLNDWLYFRLMETAVNQIFRAQSPAEKVLINWFLLSKSGYDARVTFREKQVYLCVFTEEMVFEVPMIKEQGRTFVNLSEVGQKEQNQNPVYLLDYVPNPNGKPFSFSLSQMPQFRVEVEQKYLKFSYRDSIYNWPVQVNRTLIKLMENYPFIDEMEYVKAPLSSSLLNTLIPQIKSAVRNMSQQEAVQFITVFTRSAFRYMEDKSYFGKSKPMIPDEVLHYPFSDCEDRSALFYALVKNILDLPMVVVAYPDHLTIGVHLPGVKGEAIYFQGNRYLVCDPTGPYNSIEIGKIPNELKGSPYEIIHHFETKQ